MKKTLLLLLLISNFCATAQSGIKWSAATDVASSSYSNEHPRIMLDASGNPLILWGNSNTSEALFSRWNGTGFTMPLAMNPGSIPVFTASWAGPDIASKGDTVYVVYKQTPEDQSANHIYLVHSYDGGKNFSSPAQVDFLGDSISRFPTLTTDALGNPIVAFMKFNSMFMDSRWAVTKSNDFGNTFTSDTKASGYAGGGICDCCPGSLVCSGNTVALLFRSNFNNIRDTWTALSTNGGASFPNGIGVDQNNWMSMVCPSTGPDAVVVDDTLYSVFMNSASGKARIYSNKNSLSAAAASTSKLVTKTFAGLSQQNYPRIANYNTAVAEVWKQVSGGITQLSLNFTANIHNGFPLSYDTVVMGSVANTDVAISKGTVHLIWEDDNSGTVKYRKGTYTPISTGVPPPKAPAADMKIYPNPSSAGMITIEMQTVKSIAVEVQVLNLMGQVVFVQTNNPTNGLLQLDISALSSGSYFVKITDGSILHTEKFIKL